MKGEEKKKLYPLTAKKKKTLPTDNKKKTPHPLIGKKYLTNHTSY